MNRNPKTPLEEIFEDNYFTIQQAPGSEARPG
jgi:hypothetical protein